MSIQDQLPKSLGRKDQEPNKILAGKILAGTESLDELVAFIKSEPDKAFLQDAILTLAYIAEQHPTLIQSHIDLFVDNLDSNVNRVVWGSMIAMSHVAPLQVENLYNHLPKILDTMNAGTPVTRDHGFRIVLSIYGDKRYAEDLFFIILELLRLAPKNQLGQYAERFATTVMNNHVPRLILTLEELAVELEDEYHIRRLNKCLKKLRKK